MKNASTPSHSSFDRAYSVLGKTCGWFLLGLIVVQFCVVLFRYVLGVNYLWAQELAIYFHAAIFMLAAGWTMLADKHVRIDVFRERMTPAVKSGVDRSGFLLLLIPMMLVIVFSSWGYVIESWRVLEGSPEISGLPGRFLLKTLLLVFAALLLLAGFVMAWRR